MIENFLQYGQWLILFLSVMSLYLVSSVKHETEIKWLYSHRCQQIFWSSSLYFCRFIRLRYSQLDTNVHCFQGVL